MPDATSIGANELVSQAVDGTTTRYRWDVGWTVLNEEGNLGNLTQAHKGRRAASKRASRWAWDPFRKPIQLEMCECSYAQRCM
jgi:hypothetical protein